MYDKVTIGRKNDKCGPDERHDAVDAERKTEQNAPLATRSMALPKRAPHEALASIGLEVPIPDGTHRIEFTSEAGSEFPPAGGNPRSNHEPTRSWLETGPRRWGDWKERCFAAAGSCRLPTDERCIPSKLFAHPNANSGATDGLGKVP